MKDRIWDFVSGDGPIVATAIHDGSELRHEIALRMELSESDRVREEDPFTGIWTEIAPNRIVGKRSRFEVDLNRSRENAVYRVPDDSWGLRVWREPLPADIIERSLHEYDAFYEFLEDLYTELTHTHGKIVVYDLHSYNHRRDGPGNPPADKTQNPQVNIGTGTMRNPQYWATVIDRFVHDLAAYDFRGAHLDVRENVKFKGGHHAAWAHQKFPESVCVLAIEVKKFFMDEWTGEKDGALLDEVHRGLRHTVPGVLYELKGMPNRSSTDG